MTNSGALSRAYADLLDDQVERLLSEQKEDGAFQADGAAYNIYDQNVMYPLALSCLREGGRYEGDTRILEAVCRSGDRHVREMNEEGKWEVITPGGRWGWYYDEWRLYFWLETLILLSSRIGAGRQARWEEAILRSAEGIASNLRENDLQGVIDFVGGTGFSSPNHMAWHFLVCRRAGVHFGRPDWVEIADKLFDQMRAGQTEDGFWLESDAPAVGHNYISLLAAGIYLEHLPAVSAEWLDRIERGMDAQLRWTYPGGGPVAEIDGRQRYHGPVGHLLPAACARWPQGAEALRESLQKLPHRIGNHSLAFISETARYLGRYPEPVAVVEEPVSAHRALGSEAGWLRSGPWQVTFCGIASRQYESRWRLDIADLIGVYHREAGLLAGGGHSKNDPGWATFTVYPESGGPPLWMPTWAGLTLDSLSGNLVLSYKDIPAESSVHLNGDMVSVLFFLPAAPEGRSAAARLLRPLAPGSEIAGPEGHRFLDPDYPVRWRLEAGEEVRVGPVRYKLPSGGSFVWPRLPFNPYDQGGASSFRESFAAFEVDLSRRNPTGEIFISV
ncbi:MAG: hypothetical protein IT210_04210 [Armatimonadetes bacterium]|nr:hypothetical protein [Armatimonadota bacterium]